MSDLDDITIEDLQFQAGPIDELLQAVWMLARPGANELGATLIDRTSWSASCPVVGEWYTYAVSLLAPLAPEPGKVMAYAVVTPPNDDPEQEWAPGYPHRHNYAWHTAVTYLDPGGDAAELWVCRDTGNWDRLRPERGKTIAFRAAAEHGIRASMNKEQFRVALVMHTMPNNVIIGGLGTRD